MLQFELDAGTKTSLLGGDTRQTEDGDQAMASIQGTSGKSDKNDFSEQEALMKKKEEKEQDTGNAPYGKANKHAVAIIKKASKPDSVDKEKYQQFVKKIEIHQRKLAGTIERPLSINGAHHIIICYMADFREICFRLY